MFVNTNDPPKSEVEVRRFRCDQTTNLFVLGLSVVFCVMAASGIIRHLPLSVEPDFVARIFCGLFAALFLMFVLASSRAVEVDGEGITEISWLGFRRRTRYKDIIDVAYGGEDNLEASTIITGPRYYIRLGPDLEGLEELFSLLAERVPKHTSAFRALARRASFDTSPLAVIILATRPPWPVAWIMILIAGLVLLAFGLIPLDADVSMKIFAATCGVSGVVFLFLRRTEVVFGNHILRRGRKVVPLVTLRKLVFKNVGRRQTCGMEGSGQRALLLDSRVPCFREITDVLSGRAGSAPKDGNVVACVGEAMTLPITLRLRWCLFLARSLALLSVSGMILPELSSESLAALSWGNALARVVAVGILAALVVWSFRPLVAMPWRCTFSERGLEVQRLWGQHIIHKSQIVELRRSAGGQWLQEGRPHFLNVRSMSGRLRLRDGCFDLPLSAVYHCLKREWFPQG